MRIAIFGKHPVPQPGFEGVMSIYEAMWFSHFGHEVDLLVPFADRRAYNELRRKRGFLSLDRLEKLGADFAVKPIFADRKDEIESYDVCVWQSYVPQEWEEFMGAMRQRCRILTKNFPKSVSTIRPSEDRRLVNQAKAFDVSAYALQEDIDALNADAEYRDAFGHRYGYVPRGADPKLLHPDDKAEKPTFALDAPVKAEPRAVAHWVQAIARLRERVPEVDVLTLGRDYPELDSTVIPFGDFRHFYRKFLNPAWAYLTINYAYSPAHLQSYVSKELPEWQHRAIYEVQNIECQMAGAALVGHREALIPELLLENETAIVFEDYTDIPNLVVSLEHIIRHRAQWSARARRFAETHFSWESCIRRWEALLLAAMEDDAQGKRSLPETPKPDATCDTSLAATASDLPSPAFIPDEARFLYSYLGRHQNVLLYGAAGSAIDIARSVAHLTVVETDPVAFEALERHTREIGLENLDLHFCAPDENPAEAFASAFALPLSWDTRYDRIILDCRGRSHAAVALIPVLKRKGLTLIHDFFPRSDYWWILEQHFQLADACVTPARDWFRRNRKPFEAFTFAVLQPAKR